MVTANVIVCAVRGRIWNPPLRGVVRYVGWGFHAPPHYFLICFLKFLAVGMRPCAFRNGLVIANVIVCVVRGRIWNPPLRGEIYVGWGFHAPPHYATIYNVISAILSVKQKPDPTKTF